MMNKCHTGRSNCRLLRQSTMEESSCLFDCIATDVLEHWKKLQLRETRNVNARASSVCRRRGRALLKEGARPNEVAGRILR